MTAVVATESSTATPSVAAAELVSVLGVEDLEHSVCCARVTLEAAICCEWEHLQLLARYELFLIVLKDQLVHHGRLCEELGLDLAGAEGRATWLLLLLSLLMLTTLHVVSIDSICSLFLQLSSYHVLF